MPGADDASLHALAERALVSALKFGLQLSQQAISLNITLDVTINALSKLPIGDIVRNHRPQPQDWAGLIIDVAEEQIINEIALAAELSRNPPGTTSSSPLTISEGPMPL